MKTKPTQTPQTPEESVANYWRKRLGDTVWVHVKPIAHEDVTVREYLADIARRIWFGLPLAFQDWHVAIGVGMLENCDGVKYHKFFTKYWWETETECGYGTKHAAAYQSEKKGKQ